MSSDEDSDDDMKRAIAASLGHDGGRVDTTPHGTPKRKSTRLANGGGSGAAAAAGNEAGGWRRSSSSGNGDSNGARSRSTGTQQNTAAVRSGTANARKRARATLRELGFDLLPTQTPSDSPVVKPQASPRGGSSSYAWDGQPGRARSQPCGSDWGGSDWGGLPPPGAFGNCSTAYAGQVREPHADTIIQWLDERTTNYHLRRQATENRTSGGASSATTTSTALHEKPAALPSPAATSKFSRKDYGKPPPATFSKNYDKGSGGGGGGGSGGSNWLAARSNSKSKTGKHRAVEQVITVDDSEDETDAATAAAAAVSSDHEEILMAGGNIDGDSDADGDAAAAAAVAAETTPEPALLPSLETINDAGLAVLPMEHADVSADVMPASSRKGGRRAGRSAASPRTQKRKHGRRNVESSSDHSKKQAGRSRSSAVTISSGSDSEDDGEDGEVGRQGRRGLRQDHIGSASSEEEETAALKSRCKKARLSTAKKSKDTAQRSSGAGVRRSGGRSRNLDVAPLPGRQHDRRGAAGAAADSDSDELQEEAATVGQEGTGAFDVTGEGSRCAARDYSGGAGAGAGPSPSESSRNSSTASSSERVACPMCQKMFKSNRIQAHAEECDGPEAQRVTRIGNVSMTSPMQQIQTSMADYTTSRKKGGKIARPNSNNTGSSKKKAHEKPPHLTATRKNADKVRHSDAVQSGSGVGFDDIESSADDSDFESRQIKKTKVLSKKQQRKKDREISGARRDPVLPIRAASSSSSSSVILVDDDDNDDDDDYDDDDDGHNTNLDVDADADADAADDDEDTREHLNALKYPVGESPADAALYGNLFAKGDKPRRQDHQNESKKKSSSYYRTKRWRGGRKKKR